MSRNKQKASNFQGKTRVKDNSKGFEGCLLPKEEYQFWDIPENEYIEAYQYEIERESRRDGSKPKSPQDYLSTIDPEDPPWTAWSVSAEKSAWDSFTHTGSSYPLLVDKELPTHPCRSPQPKALIHLSLNPYQLSTEESKSVLQSLRSTYLKELLASEQSRKDAISLALFEIDFSRPVNEILDEFKHWLQDKSSIKIGGRPQEVIPKLFRLAIYRLTRVHFDSDVKKFLKSFKAPFKRSIDDRDFRRFRKKAEDEIIKTLNYCISENFYEKYSTKELVNVKKDLISKYPDEYLRSVTRQDA
ncbi:MAG: hypothetical protein ACFHW5_06745 [Verrucomicrobiota bacterium]